MTRYSRADIGLRSPRGGPGSLSAANVRGLAFHWPGMSKPLASVGAVKANLRGWQSFHMDKRGWSDIAYQVAVDQAGNRYELRGLHTQSGANGDNATNRTYGACLLILAPGEQPSDAMVREVQAVVRDHRALFPNSTRLLGHADVRPEPTACPGPAALAAIRAGRFEPTEDDMPRYTEWPQEDRDALVRDVVNGLQRRDLYGDDRKRTPAGVFRETDQTLDQLRDFMATVLERLPEPTPEPVEPEKPTDPEPRDGETPHPKGR